VDPEDTVEEESESTLVEVEYGPGVTLKVGSVEVIALPLMVAEGVMTPTRLPVNAER
jgi:hypothetical protein